MKLPKPPSLKFRTLLKKKWISVPLSAVLLVYVLYASFITHNEPTQIGIARNLITGEMWSQDDGGYFFSAPWTWVARIDTRPVRVAVTSGGHGYSGRLVQFDKNYWKEFVEIEGWRYWWWSNRISINFGYDEEYRGMRDILRGYAYSPKHYPFVVILEEYQSK